MPADFYARDSLTLLEAIEQWVDEYTALFYSSDSEVQADGELQAVLSEMHRLSSSSSAVERSSAIRGLPASLSSRRDLVDLLSHLIWSAAVQHHSRNTYSL